MKIAQLAKVISQISRPVLTFPLTILLIFGSEQAWQSFILVIILSFALPFLGFLSLFSSKKISDFDVSNRKQRYPIYGLSLLGMTISLIFLHFLNPGFLFYEFLRLFLLAIALVLINLKIKVSIHTATATILCISLTELYQWSPWIFLFVPLVIASRLILKRHSWLEVSLGVLVPLLFYIS